MSERTSERSGGRERSEQSGASERVSGASEQANGRASGPELTSRFLFVPDHSALVWTRNGWVWRLDCYRILKKILHCCSLLFTVDQVNKATMGHLGMLKAKLAKLKRELITPSSGGGGKGEGFDVAKTGDAKKHPKGGGGGSQGRQRRRIRRSKNWRR